AHRLPGDHPGDVPAGALPRGMVGVRLRGPRHRGDHHLAHRPGRLSLLFRLLDALLRCPRHPDRTAVASHHPLAAFGARRPCGGTAVPGRARALQPFEVIPEESVGL
ncbi:hypothetical protein BHE94_18920, partial [Bacillus pumilus]